MQSIHIQIFKIRKVYATNKCKYSFFSTDLDKIFMSTEIVEKERVPAFKPVSHEVLPAPDARKHRMHQLMQFLKGGNQYKAKSWIYFHTLQGIKAVHTTIWSVTDRHVALKGGVLIPIHAISDVQP